MPVYDEVSHRSECKHCGTAMTFTTQIKHENAWANVWVMGDKITCSSDNFSVEGWTHPPCRTCGQDTNFDAHIENGRIVKMTPRLGPD